MIVNTSIDYTYSVLEEDIKNLKSKYSFIETGIMGNSVLGKNLSYIKLGDGDNVVFYNGTHHGLEWITSVLLMKFIENFCEAFDKNKSIRGYNIKTIWNKSTIYIVPMVNPDGVDLVLNGIENVRFDYQRRLFKWNKGQKNFSDVWQANIRGVDLNHNYNASWRESKMSEVKNNILGPGPTRYSGRFPESEPEAKAIADFTRFNNFNLVMALHSQGKEIFWNYRDMEPKISREIAEKFSKVSGYEVSTPEGMASFSGYKDWFIEKYKKPGFTIEVGKGKNPLPISQFNEIYNDIEEMLLLASIITL